MLNKRLLSAQMAKEGYSQRKLAEALGMTQNTLSLRMNGKRPFTVNEAQKICLILNVTDPTEKEQIFLA